MFHVCVVCVCETTIHADSSFVVVLTVDVARAFYILDPDDGDDEGVVE